MSLAEELQADFEEGGEEEARPTDEDVAEDVDVIDDVVAMETEAASSDSVKNVAKLRDSDQLRDLLDGIEYFQDHVGPRQVNGPTESDPEYQVIVDANNIIVEVDNEIKDNKRIPALKNQIRQLLQHLTGTKDVQAIRQGTTGQLLDRRLNGLTGRQWGWAGKEGWAVTKDVIHKYVRDLYNKRFPELESLVPLPIEYLKTVKELGNSIDNSKNNEVLQDFLTPATIMVVSVTASTTQGSELTKEELERVNEACNMAIDLIKNKAHIQTYVESRMAFIAPNLSIIIGASTAAKLMGAAGGLGGLCKMPACNVLVLGAQKKTLSGFSSTAILPHTGFIYYSDIVQKTPADLRKKVARLISSKCTLAARVDNFHESSDGKIGNKLLEDIEQKLDKLQEPPPVKTIKPLPAPIDAPRKKRGGRRHRKMKERLGMTEMRKRANRMNFGEIEDDAYQEDLGLSLGSLGKSASGKVRGPVVDSKTKARISKTLQQKITKTQTWGGSTTVKKQVSGTASSVAFTPLQGLEIVNPHAAEKQIEAGSKSQYFSSTAGFLKLGRKSTT